GASFVCLNPGTRPGLQRRLNLRVHALGFGRRPAAGMLALTGFPDVYMERTNQNKAAEGTELHSELPVGVVVVAGREQMVEGLCKVGARCGCYSCTSPCLPNGRVLCNPKILVTGQIKADLVVHEGRLHVMSSNKK